MRASWRTWARTASTRWSWLWPSRRNSTSTSRTRKPRSCVRWDRRCSTSTKRWGNRRMTRRVASTGLGSVPPLGTDGQTPGGGVIAGRGGAGPITRFDPVQSPVKSACEVKGSEPTRFLDKKEIRRYDLFAQFAVGAAEQAVTDACLSNNWDKVDLKRIGAIVGTGTGGLQTFEENARALFEKGPSRVSPFFVPMYMPNVAAALISMRYGAKGPNYCTVSACASSAHSVGDALELIRHDQADIMIAGGAEAAITPLAVASFANMKALSERNDSPQTASRPFDKDRDGFVMGDGAGVLILEEWEHARRRGAKIYAEVVGFGQTADAYHITAPAPDGSGAQEAMRLAMRDGGIEPDEVGYINAHGTSTPHGDAAETAAVKAVFGDRARKLVFGSTKSMTGHLLGAAGAFEAGVCALVVQTGVIPPTINQFTRDPACDLDSAPNKAVKRHVDVALSNSFGFGGHNVTLALRRAAGIKCGMRDAECGGDMRAQSSGTGTGARSALPHSAFRLPHSSSHYRPRPTPQPHRGEGRAGGASSPRRRPRPFSPPRPAHDRPPRRPGEPPAQRRPGLLRRESAHQPHERLRPPQHVRVLLVRADAPGGGGLHAHSRRGFRRGGRGARQPHARVPHRGGPASQAPARLLRRHVPRPQGAPPERAHQGAHRGRDRAPRAHRAAVGHGRPHRAESRRRHEPSGRRGRGVQPRRARHDRRPETHRRRMAGGASRSPSARSAVELHHAVRTPGGHGGPRRPPAPAARTPGRKRRVSS